MRTFILHAFNKAGEEVVTAVFASNVNRWDFDPEVRSAAFHLRRDKLVIHVETEHALPLEKEKACA